MKEHYVEAIFRIADYREHLSKLHMQTFSTQRRI